MATRKQNAIGFWARMPLGSGPECHWVLGPNAIDVWARMRLGSGTECDWVLGPNAIGFWARMRLGSGPECDWVPGPNEIWTWDKMRLSEMVEMRGDGDSVGYRCHGIVPILSDHAANVAASNTRFIFCNTMT